MRVAVVVPRFSGVVESCPDPVDQSAEQILGVLPDDVVAFHPKTILFFVAFAAQFIQHHGAYLPQAAILVGTFTLIAAPTDTLYALSAWRVSGLVHRPTARKWSQRAGGGAVITAGIALGLASR